MVTLTLHEVPTLEQLTTALHQDEGIIIQTERGERYTFVPSRSLTVDGGIKGTYCQLARGQFTDIRGEAVLYISNEQNIAKLELLTN